jgi:predicted SAM-dependent methyltransferase
VPNNQESQLAKVSPETSSDARTVELDFLVTESLKSRIPWFLKIPAKILLSRLPFGLRNWQSMNVFRAGDMDSPEYAYAIFKKHFEAVGLGSLDGSTVLELGPGNSLLSALYARSFGAASTWLIDGERLASENTSLFSQAEEILSRLHLRVPGVSGAGNIESVLKQLNAVYRTSGLQSFRTVPDGGVDFLFSNAVLEHIRLAEFADTVREMRRVLKPTGVASHVIDFRDHLQYALNNLRFSERTWESKFMASSGFYTNRITWPTMEKIFQRAGFIVELYSCERWPGGLPTRQTKMASPFRELPAEDLMTMTVHAVLRPIL